MAATKINLTKLVHTINANVVFLQKKLLHGNLSYESFFTRKFPDLRYSMLLLLSKLQSIGMTVINFIVNPYILYPNSLPI